MCASSTTTTTTTTATAAAATPADTTDTTTIVVCWITMRRQFNVDFGAQRSSTREKVRMSL